ncbi:hypothetical protein Ahy_A01g003311 [Arachis hypogaea]|uniref:FAR1 domain-containing protein n=1 Tax=Arachis hypogaea TaxID=3818 RepID=A0A445ET35_ARAHY|nr:hypothetical protein Ahy_A01g003311 [Arachis hypogaea]
MEKRSASRRYIGRRRKKHVLNAEMGSDDTELSHELSNHTSICDEKIPSIGLGFNSWQQAQEFYTNYAKKVGFVTKTSINQSIHCNRKSYRESRVRATSRRNKIIATRCITRMYVMFDGEKENWMLSRLKLRHSHPCSAKKFVHYHAYREMTIHAMYVIEDNDEIDIQPNKTYLALANEVGRSSNVSYSEKEVKNYITGKLHNVDVKKMLEYFLQMK